MQDALTFKSIPIIPSGFIEKKTQEERVLEILENAKGGWVDGMIFYNLESPITQYHARIFGLQRKGHNIKAEWVEGKNWKKYRLIPKDTLF